MTPKLYDLAAHYDVRCWQWIVGGDRTRLYASAGNTWITDAGTVAEVIASGRVSSIASLAELAEVLRGQAPGLVPDWLVACPDFVQPERGAYTAEQLHAYAAHARWRAEVRGVRVRLSTGETVPVSTARGDDRIALQMVVAAIDGGMRPDGATFKFADGVARPIQNDDMRIAAAAALDHVQRCFDVEADLVSRIVATPPGVTVTAQIDAAFV